MKSLLLSLSRQYTVDGQYIPSLFIEPEVRHDKTSYTQTPYSHGIVVVMGTTGIYTHTASLYELAFTATRSVSDQSCEVKQRRARLVAGWVTQALEQGRLGSCSHAGYHQYYNGVRSV